MLIDAVWVPRKVAVTVTFWHNATGNGSTTVIVNVCGRLAGWPPLAVPPLSDSVTVTVATPPAPAAGVYVSVPFRATAGCPVGVKSALLLLVTVKPTSACPLSFAGPVLICVAHPVTVCAGKFFATDWLAPLVKVGRSFTAVMPIVTVPVPTPPSASLAV